MNTTYASGSYTTLYNAAINRTGGLCAQQSQNSRQVTIGGVPTPVQLLSFGATWKGAGKAEITWAVTAEKAIWGYAVERSYDANRFEEVARLPANALSNSYQQYLSLDGEISPLAQQVYYRLRILENRGSANFSGIVKLDMPQQMGNNAFAIAPNPLLAGKLAASLWLKEAGAVSITVKDVSGRQLRRFQNTFGVGENAIALDLSDLVPGMYLVVVQGANFQWIEKLIR